MLKHLHRIKRDSVYGLLLFNILFFNSIGYKLGAISMLLLIPFFLLDKQLLQKFRRLNWKYVALFAGYLLIHAIGILYSDNARLSEHESVVRLPFLLLPVVIFTEKIQRSKLNVVLVAFKYWLLFFACYLIYHKLYIVQGPLISLPELSLRALTGIHQAYFSLFYMFALFFVMYQVERNKVGLFWGYLQIGFILFFISVLGARVMMTIAVLVTVIFTARAILRTKLVLRLLLLGVLIVSSLLIVRNTNFSEKFSRLSKIEWDIDKNIYNHQVFSFEYDDVTSNTLELRLIKWYCALQIVKEHPIIGVGTGDYKDELNKMYRSIEFKKGMVYGYNTHNQYLEEFIKFGTVGGLFFLFFIGYILKDAIVKKNSLLFLTALTVAAFLLIESAFSRQHGVIFFCFFVPVLYIYHNLLETHKKSV